MGGDCGHIWIFMLYMSNFELRHWIYGGGCCSIKLYRVDCSPPWRLWLLLRLCLYIMRHPTTTRYLCTRVCSLQTTLRYSSSHGSCSMLTQSRDFMFDLDTCLSIGQDYVKLFLLHLDKVKGKGSTHYH